MSPLDLSLGAVELGVLVSTVLFGVATTQAWLYLERNFKDALYIRIMVSDLTRRAFRSTLTVPSGSCRSDLSGQHIRFTLLCCPV